MWAPDCIEKDGKYYYYYPAKPKNDNAFRRIGVGVSDTPTGPFKWENSFIKGVSGIDPGLLLDDDNKAYLFFGGGHELYVAPLKDNMKEISARITSYNVCYTKLLRIGLLLCKNSITCMHKRFIHRLKKLWPVIILNIIQIIFYRPISCILNRNIPSGHIFGVLSCNKLAYRANP